MYILLTQITVEIIIFVRMKFLTLIFSIYLLGLSCLPCADKDECNNINTTTKISTSADNEKQHPGNESCTPFCSCTHCPASAFCQSIVPYKIPKIIFPSVEYPVYEISFSSKNSFSIWQPPQLG